MNSDVSRQGSINVDSGICPALGFRSLASIVPILLDIEDLEFPQQAIKAGLVQGQQVWLGYTVSDVIKALDESR